MTNFYLGASHIPRHFEWFFTRMKERSKERYASLLIQELSEHLSRRENIKMMLGNMVSMPVDELIAILLDDFERVIEKRMHDHRVIDDPPESSDDSPLRVVPSDRKQDPVPSVNDREPDDSEDDLPKRTRPVNEKTDSPAVDTLLKRLNEKLDQHDGEIDSDTPEFAPKKGHFEKPLPKRRLLKIPYSLNEADHVYLHAVSRIPEGETASSTPFMLEEKGIDQQTFAFAVDHDGLRFFASTFLPSQMAISKTGVLLLGKAEGQQFRGVHEAILNDLRVHGTILPFGFGTVGISRSDIFRSIDDEFDGIEGALDEIEKTDWWTLNLFVLDARIGELFREKGSTSGPSRERNRVSHSKLPPAKKIDIKLLEKILQKEKKIAENVHKSLDEIADRSDVDKMIGLTSGTSEDWKVILKASYEVPQSRLDQFNRTVNELQYDHILFDLMFQVEGNRESYSLRRS